MILSTTDEYKTAVNASYREWLTTISIINDTENLLELFGKQIVSAKVQEATFSNTVSIGNVTSSMLEAEIILEEKRKLTGGEIDFVLSLKVGEGAYEDIAFQTFYITSAEPIDNTNHYKITAYDAIMKQTATRAYASGLTYPATLNDVAAELANICGLTWSDAIEWQNFTITSEIVADTAREALAVVGELMGGNVFINRQGDLDICFLEETDIVIKPDHYYSPFTHSDVPYYMQAITYMTETANYTATIAETNTTKNPIKLSVSNVFAVQRVANYVTDRLNASFCSCDNFKFLGDPSLCCGNIITVEELDGTTCQIAIMSHTISYDGGVTSTVACYGDTDEVSEYKASAKKNNTKLDKTSLLQEAYDSAQELLTKWADSGYVRVYPNEILIMNTPDKETATKIWRFNEGGLAFYPEGLSGEVLNLALTMDGQIVADRIKFGTLGDQKGKFWVNMETGEMNIGSNALVDGETPLNQYVNNAIANISVTLSNEYEAIQTDLDGNYADITDITTTVQVRYGNTDITEDCTYSIEETNLVGQWNNTTKTYTVTLIEADKGYADITATYLGGLSVTKRFTVAKIKVTAEGGALFDLECSDQTLTVESDGTCLLDSVSFYAYQRPLTSMERQAYSGIFLIENLDDNGNWTTVYKSNAVESNTSFNLNRTIITHTMLMNTDGKVLYDANTGNGLLIKPIENITEWVNFTQLRCTLLAAEDTDETLILAKQTIDFVLKDAELSQEDVFNLLTNNGEEQGLYMAGGKLYLNMSYAKTGTLDAGLVKAGILTDSTGENYWNLETGKLCFKELESTVSKKVGEDEFNTLMQQNYESFILGWNGGSNYIQFNKTNISMYNGEISDAKLTAKYGYNGMRVYDVGESSNILRFLAGTTTSGKAQVIWCDEEGDMAARFYQDSLRFYSDTSASKLRTKLDRTGMTLNDDSGSKLATFDGNGMHFYNSSGTQISEITRASFTFGSTTFSNGALYDTTNNLSIARAGHGVLIGNTNYGTEITGSTVRIYNASLSDPTISGNVDGYQYFYGDSNTVFNRFVIFQSSVTYNSSLWGDVSDARLKDNIKDTEINALDIINDIELKSYDWLESKQTVDIGVVAQQLKEVVPSLVHQDETTGTLSVKSMSLIMYLIKAVQELSSQINDFVGNNKTKKKAKEKWRDTYTYEEKMNFIEKRNNYMQQLRQEEQSNDETATN